MIKELFKERIWHRDGEKFRHNQVFSNGMMYIYAVGYVNDDSCWYEVFLRKIVPDVLVVDGKMTPSSTDYHCKYPSNESFGKWAWCCHDKECIRRAIRENKGKFTDDVIIGLEKWLSEAK